MGVVHVSYLATGLADYRFLFIVTMLTWNATFWYLGHIVTSTRLFKKKNWLNILFLAKVIDNLTICEIFAGELPARKWPIS